MINAIKFAIEEIEASDQYFDHTGAKREAMVAMAKELFDVVQSGVVKININQTYPLKDVSKAHRDLEARKTTGSTVLTI